MPINEGFNRWSQKLAENNEARYNQLNEAGGHNLLFAVYLKKIIDDGTLWKTEDAKFYTKTIILDYLDPLEEYADVLEETSRRQLTLVASPVARLKQNLPEMKVLPGGLVLAMNAAGLPIKKGAGAAAPTPKVPKKLSLLNFESLAE